MSKYGEFTDLRDGKVYRTIVIGEQLWLGENLAYIPHVSPGKTQGGIWVYGFEGTDVNIAKSTNNYKQYGCLYDWKTAMKVAPPGWHLPTEKEWLALQHYFGSGTDGAKMKDADSGLWAILMAGTNNSSGFSALPAGIRNGLGQFDELGKSACFWSASKFSSNDAWQYFLEAESNYLRCNPTLPIFGFSVRCISDT